MSIVAICIRARLVARFLKFGKIITQLTAAEKKIYNISLMHTVVERRCADIIELTPRNNRTGADNARSVSDLRTPGRYMSLHMLASFFAARTAISRIGTNPNSCYICEKATLKVRQLQSEQAPKKWSKPRKLRCRSKMSFQPERMYHRRRKNLSRENQLK